MKKIKEKILNWMLPCRWLQEGVIAAIIFLFAIIIFTWPLAKHIREAVPAGSEAPAVALFQLFSAEWTGKAIDEGRPYWSAPFFHPFAGAFAWCEPQLLSCILIWLLAKITGYILAYNIIIFLYLGSLGLCGYACSRLLSEDRISALWVGIWLSAGAYSLQQICALPLIAACFPCGCLLFSLWYIKSKKLTFFWLAVLSCILTWFSCKQFAFFTILFFPIALCQFFFRKRIHYSAVLHLLLGLFVVLAAVLPYSLQQLSHTHAMGFARTLCGVKGVFMVSDFIMPAKGHWLVTHILGWGNDPEFYSWSLGISVILTMMLAFFSGFLRPAGFNPFQKKVILSFVLIIIIALFLGFGPKSGVVIKGKNFSPYAFIFSVIPGMNFVRAPARFGIFAIFAIAVLSAPAFTYIRSRIKNKFFKPSLCLLFFLLLFAEIWTMPIPVVFPKREISEYAQAIEWLAKNAGGSALLELPLPQRTWPQDAQVDIGAMLRMLKHGNPVVNGYASFSPVAFKQLRSALVNDPIGLGRRYIDAYGVRYILLHKHKMLPEKEKILRRAFMVEPAYEDHKCTIYSLPQEERTGGAEGFFSNRITFGRQGPQKGKAYALAVSQPLKNAILIAPQAKFYIYSNWTDKNGKQRFKMIRMRGSVILDAGTPKLYFRIIRFPKGNKEAEAVLLGPDEIVKVLD